MSQTTEINKDTNKIFHFNNLIIKKLQQDKLNLDHLFILECLYYNNIELLLVYSENLGNERVNGYFTTLKRKELISLVDNVNITQDGKEYYEFICSLNGNRGSGYKTIGVAKGLRKEGFEEWWAMYPANSRWEDKNTGTKFIETRPLRTGKEQCKKKYDNLINSGKIEHHQLMDCLKYEIKSRKIDSLKNNKNQLCFMKNSLSYLNQEAFMAFAEDIVLDHEFIENCDECDMDISHDDIYNSNTELGN